MTEHDIIQVPASELDELSAINADLLAALERVLSHERDIVYLFNRLGEGSPANFSLDCEKARAAIAKATA
jgi:hypothetical protein